MTFGSLFAGIGGLDLGLERAGMSCKWQVEIDDYATRVLERHWPNVRRWDDVHTWPQPDTERVDVIAGGFPCQDISYAGLGTGLDGKRSGLFFEAIRVVQQLKPRIVVLENVAALLTRGLDRVLGTLAQIGYDAEWDILSAAAFGFPHYRERVFIVGYNRNATGLRRRAALRSFQRISADDSRIRAEKFMHNQPRMVGGNDGVSRRMDARRCLGNAVVPQVAEWIGRRIMEVMKCENGLRSA